MKKLKIFFFFLLLKACSFYQLEQRFRSRNTDFDLCMMQDVNKCPDIKFEAKGFQCCKTTVNQAPSCSPMIFPIKLAQDEMATENGKILTRENIGFSMFKDNLTSSSYEFECPDGKLAYKYEDKNYTIEEHKKFKSQNHCLNYYNRMSISITKETCYKADLATTGNSGVSCGYYEFDMKMSDNSNYKFQTCFLFNDDIIATKNLGYLKKQMGEDVALRVAIENEKELSSYKMTGTNSKNKCFIYDSVNDEVSIPGDDKPTDSDEHSDTDVPSDTDKHSDTDKPSDTTDGTKPNISKFINSKYILLLILFYILSY